MDKHMEVDMDDLFGDGAALMSQPHPPPKKLFKRIDQLRTSGCHQSVTVLMLNIVFYAALTLIQNHCLVSSGLYCLHHP